MSEAKNAPLTELDALERELQRSEQDLDECLARHAAAMPRAVAGEADTAAEEAAGDREQQVAAKRPRERAETARRPEAATASPPASAGDARSDNPCARACRALASMRNSVERLCALTGSAHQRCRNAQARVAGAAQRVNAAECVCREEDP